MKPYSFCQRIIYFLAASITSAFALSCSKPGTADAPPAPPAVPPVVTGNTTFSFTPANPDYWNILDDHYELVVSTTGGEILVDTVMSTKVTVPISFQTTEKLVDVTTIAKYRDTVQYEVNTYKGVNPTGWDSLYFYYNYNVDPVKYAPSSGQRKIYYKNLPAGYDQHFLFYSGNDLAGGSTGPNSIGLTYNKVDGLPAYILFPTLGLYNLYDQTKAEDTVDLTSQLKTATRLKINYPTQYTISRIEVMGFADTTNYYLNHILFYDISWYYTDYQVIYPHDPFYQKYQLRFNLEGTDNDWIRHFSYSDTIAANITFYQPSNYTTSSTTKDNFAVKFNNVIPSWYSVSYQSGPVAYTIYASPDSTSLNPSRLLNTIKSKSNLLGALNFDDLHISSFVFEKIEGMDYAAHNNYTFISRLRTKHLINSADRYIKWY